MQKDFHYYATYCAARLAGYGHEEGMEICYSAQLTDWCSRTFLGRLRAPKAAATTQLQLELADARTDLLGLQDITRIWASFHFLPYDLYAKVERSTRLYRNKYRLICKPNGSLVADTVELAKGGSVGRYTGYYYTASMAAQTVTPYLSGLLMDKAGMTTLFPYAVVFSALAFVSMLPVRHGDSRPPMKKNKLEMLDND